MKMYHCSCEGFPDNKASIYGVAFYKKQVHRTDCKARLCVACDSEGVCSVTVFHDIHNHELVSPEEDASVSNMSHARKSLLEPYVYDPMDSMRKISKLDNSDVDALLQYFNDKSSSEPNFFWKVLLDDEGRLMNFFFRDCRCADDYKSFGDVLSVDTTFRTNKYNMICAPFVGINHHRQNAMFGLAFLLDDSSRSFEWLFTTFLESMGGKEPEIIFSDPNRALMNGIDYCFRTAHHRLCQWHINQNTPSYFGSLNDNKAFKRMWYHLMNGCETWDEFDESWQLMIDTYGLADKRWFTRMYHLRRRWASVFANSRFSAGLVATSLSEATYNVIKDLCSVSGSLHELVLHYEKSIQNDWRLRERREDVLNLGMPVQFVKNNRLLKHAAQVYTRVMYSVFEQEVRNSFNVDIINSLADLFVLDDLDLIVIETSGSRKTRKVRFSRITEQVSCSCMMLESEGMFCKHMLKVFFAISIKKLPEHHIMKRWRKDANHRDPSTWTATSAEGVSNMIFVSSIMRQMYDMAMDCKDIPECRNLILDRLRSLEEELTKLIGTRKRKPVDEISEAVNIEISSFPKSTRSKPLMVSTQKERKSSTETFRC